LADEGDLFEERFGFGDFLKECVVNALLLRVEKVVCVLTTTTTIIIIK